MPVAHLTVKSVGTLPAVAGKRTDYTDSLCPGLVLRVSPTGARSWGVAVFRDGTKRRVTLGRLRRVPLGRARELAREVIAALDDGREPALERLGRGLRISRLVTRCLADLKLRPTTRVEWERLARVEIIPALGQRRARELRRAEIREWIRGIRERSVHTAAAALKVLARAYSWGASEDLVEASPCIGIRLPPAGQCDRVLSADELWALQRALRAGDRRYPMFSSVVRLLLLTGVRRGAALGLRRGELQDLDGPEPRWIVPAERSKNGRAHVVPLSPASVAAMKARLSAVAETEHLFPAYLKLGKGKHRLPDVPALWQPRFRAWLHRRLAAALYARRRAAGLDRSLWRAPVPRWRIHDLRHTVATHLREDLGVRSDVVSLILGHTAPGSAVDRIYNRAELLPERRAALEQWADWLDRLAGAATADTRPSRRRPQR